MTKTHGAIIGLAILIFAVTVGVWALDVDVTQEGELPSVSFESGEMPEVDVDAADVDVGTEERTVEVPTVDVDPPERD